MVATEETTPQRKGGAVLATNLNRPVNRCTPSRRESSPVRPTSATMNSHIPAPPSCQIRGINGLGSRLRDSESHVFYPSANRAQLEQRRLDSTVSRPQGKRKRAPRFLNAVVKPAG